MARNWAICVGVNEYDNLPNLKFAKRDAEQMQQYFLSDVKFNKVYLFTDDSPPIDDADKPYASRPTYGALRRFLRVRFEDKFLSDGDNLWFFFSGHGIRHQDRDYLLPSDADPDPAGIDDTAIPISYVSERLRRSGADNVILVLDACRNEQSSKDVGIGYDKQQGVITFSSCSPAERSYEIEALKHGAFTYVLLESLRIQGEGNCATVERLSQRIKYRVSEINRDHEKPKQTPYPMVEPASKYHLILLPNTATSQDIMTLKNDAFKAEIQKQWNLAKQLWMRVNVAAKGMDMDAIEAIQRFPSFINNLSMSDNQVAYEKILKGSKSQLVGDEIEHLFSELESEPIELPNPFWGLFNNSEQEAANDKKRSKEIEKLMNKNGVLSEIFEKIKEDKKVIFARVPDRYKQLTQYLYDQRFEDADKETNRVMLEIVEKKEDQWLTVEEIQTFPCKDLKLIDQLWTKYSNGRFGFSVQKRIWLTCTNEGEYDWEIHEKFIQKVQWMIDGQIQFEKKSNFCDGYYPRGEVYTGTEYSRYLKYLFCRVENCGF